MDHSTIVSLDLSKLVPIPSKPIVLTINIIHPEGKLQDLEMTQKPSLTQHTYLAECRNDSLKVNANKTKEKNKPCSREVAIKVKRKTKLGFQKSSSIGKSENSQALRHGINQVNTTKKARSEICTVCNKSPVTDHIHYGGRSCPKCRAFFRRSVHRLRR